MTKLVQIADDHGTDTDIIRLVGTGEADLVPLYTYLISEDSGQEFFLQVSSSNRNLSRFSPQPFDTIALSQILALIEDRGYEKESLISHIRYYEADIIARIEEGKPKTPFIRPSTGSIARAADPSEIVKCLRLPWGEEDFRMGKLAQSGTATVPVHITEETINHHILVAGATGSGKSELLANLAHVADAMGRCIILFDHKPDHQNHHEENPDAEFPRAFSLPDNSEGEAIREVNGTGEVSYWTLDSDDPNPRARLLGIPAHELDPWILGGSIFHRVGEENQAETFAAIAAAYAGREVENGNQEWTIHSLIKFVRDAKSPKEVEALFSDTGVPLQRQTYDAIKRKIVYGQSRIPSFVDPQPALTPLGSPTRSTSQLKDVLRPGLNVIRISEGDARGYALFLSYLLAVATEARAGSIQSTQSASNSTGEILIIIDEAADIFKADSKYLRDVATGMLAERIRKGRSLRIGYVIAVQNAGDVPETIRHNLNTTIVGRHRRLNTLREALPTVRDGLLSQADKLGPGEMLVDLFKVPSLLHVKMDRSRSRLTVAS